MKSSFKWQHTVAEDVYLIPRELPQCSWMLDWKAQPYKPAEPPQLTTVLHLFQHGRVSAGLAKLYLEPRGERTFVVTKIRFKPKGSKWKDDSHCKVCHSLLPSPSSGPDSGSSEYLWLTTDSTHFWSPQFWPYKAQCHPSSTSPTIAGTKAADQLSPTSPNTRHLLSLPCRVRPHFLERRQRWNLLHLQAINPFYLPEPSIDGNSCVAVFP